MPPPSLVGSGLSWRNAAYALQWWVFALFAGYMWWRMVRDDYEYNRHGDGDDSGGYPDQHDQHLMASVGDTGKARNV